MSPLPTLPTRRQVLAAACGTALFLAATPSQAANAVLPTVQSFADEFTRALKARQPLVVMVSLEGCPFCRIARNNYLDPLRRNEGVPVVQIDMRSNLAVRDFQGVARTQDEMVRAWNIKVAPTVLFFGPQGKEVAERLEGGYIEDFYGAYLDQRMQTARAVVKA